MLELTHAKHEQFKDNNSNQEEDERLEENPLIPENSGEVYKAQ